MSVATWRAVQLAITFASGKSMLDLFQNSSGTRVHRVYRIYQWNNQTAAVTGVLTNMRINRITASSAGSTVTPVAHDTSNSALSANTSAGTNRTVTASDNFRQFFWSNDEPSVSAATMDEWELFVPFTEVWNAGYADTNVQPLVCRTTQGIELHHQGSTAVGQIDAEIEFTDEAS